jgi:hypothetical protein
MPRVCLLQSQYLVLQSHYLVLQSHYLVLHLVLHVVVMSCPGLGSAKPIEHAAAAAAAALARAR